MTVRPRVSVCLPTYNRSALLREAMQSVLSQTFEDWELIVSDNASTDDTEQTVRAFADSRIRYSRQPQNRGQVPNYNHCLSLARGEYITIFSDDDLMLSENLASKVAVLDRHPNVGLVYSKYHVIDATGEITMADTNWGHGVERTMDSNAGRIEVLSARGNLVNSPTAVFRRACYERLGGFTSRLRFAFDYEYWLKIAALYEVAFLARPLIKWRLHPGTVTNMNLGDRPGLQRLEVLSARLFVLRKYSSTIPNSDRLKAEVTRTLGLEIFGQGDAILNDGGPSSRARKFVRQQVWAFPETLREGPVWKISLKTILGVRAVKALKKMFAL